ncbi:MAG TPA: ATP-binding protein [Candidatus Eisenbacteria bacterium]|nr:ATP-binding protein [Candidatus Eisenbacteria bacterium]
MGETRVDLLHLLEDLRDAYTGSLEETILTEIVANSLDSGARTITLAVDAAQRTLTIVDDGSGMKRVELRRYHDIAASTKTRGQGIGFAGVGIKLALLICDSVHTETRRGKNHVASRWHLASRHRAPWKWVDPEGLVAERGTCVRLQLTNQLSPLLDAGFVEATLRRHYLPLFEPAFGALLSAHYPDGIRFLVNGRPLEPRPRTAGERGTIEVRVGRRRKPSAWGELVRDTLPLNEDERGIAISTLGKIIRRGWEWLGITPATPQLIGGLIEVPGLAECLTLNKADFIRSGARGAMYLMYRKAIQKAVLDRLAEWGDARDASEEARRRVTRPVERDLEKVLIDMADDFPLLGTLVERRAGGQKRLPIGGPAPHADARSLVAASIDDSAVAIAEPAVESADARPQPASSKEPNPPAAAASMPGPGTARRPARYGLTIEFETRCDQDELARLVESTVWVNDAHPAYRRAVASRSEGYHLALSVALALAPLAVEPASEHGFVTAFLARWGNALKTSPR